MKVTLSHARNPDISGGYWDKPIDAAKPRSIPCDSFADAAYVARRYITRNNLGGGNWTGGQITDEFGKTVARVSFNGRVWDLNDKEIAA